ncbi:MAG: LysR family transcriptional regulator [Gammaproteobacteria bacterium HGW-Gammaproteobacteria-4]|jgi:DNA-binding transcriptional LysR family regulator|nr:MAG: LysR family transcriptional regulator [Gammaproteobacteria bacterium HGW-Gammaproteobacteria-4]
MNRHREMTVFQAVAEDLSLAAAARRLQLSVATVTRAIDTLESRLGISLLARHARGVSLTEAGIRFADDCRRILAQVAEAQESAIGLHAQPRGRLHVAMPLLFGQELLTPILLDYLAGHPAVHVVARDFEHCPSLHEVGIDVAIQIGTLPDSSLFALTVGSVRRVVCASTAYLQAHGEPNRPEEIRNHRIIHASADARLTEWRFSDQGKQRNVGFRPHLICTTHQAAIAAASRHAGITRCLSYQIHGHVAQGQLRAVLQRYELPSYPVHIVYREGRRASARVRSFVDFVVCRLRDHPALR